MYNLNNILFIHYSDMIVNRGHSLIGKTAILHIVILGSSPNVSKHIILTLTDLDRYIYNNQCVEVHVLIHIYRYLY